MANQMPTNTAKKNVLIATHLKPAFHGQALIAGQLIECSKNWESVNLVELNTVYADERSKLKGFNLKKVFRLIKYILSARKLIKKNQIESVILCPAFFKGSFLKDALFILVLEKIHRVDIILWIHMDPNRLAYNDQSGWYKRIVNKVFKSVKLCVSCAPSIQKTYPEWLLSKTKVYDIANGIENMAIEVDRSGSPEPEVCKVMYLSAIDDEKGWRELLTAAREICSKHNDFMFLFYGGVGENLTEAEITEAFSEEDFKGKVMWLGAAYGDEKHEAFKEATLFVLPSYTEQFPLVVLEAMSYGLPVIATNVGAINGALPVDELIVPKDAKALRKAIEDLWGDKQLMKQQSVRNKARFLADFTLDEFSKNWRSFLASKRG